MAANDYRRSIEVRTGWVGVEYENGTTMSLGIVLPGQTVFIDLELDELQDLLQALLGAKDIMAPVFCEYEDMEEGTCLRRKGHDGNHFQTMFGRQPFETPLD